MKKSTVLLDLSGVNEQELIDKDLRDGLSAATRTGSYLWVMGDEQLSVQRLEKTANNTYGNSKSFSLCDYISLSAEKEEADVEGMDFDGRYLWIVGSHSYKRSNIKAKNKNPEKEIKKLTRISLDSNRLLLARIPCQPNEKGEYELYKKCPDPDNPDKQLTAAKIKHNNKYSALTKALKDDEHLSPFLTIPGKDNGFDIEGVAAYKDRIFLGLRGPVLRGWAIMLEVKIKKGKKKSIKLGKVNKNGNRYRKYFLDLNGMGIRELAPDGEHLLILAGPTMDLDGSMAIYRLENVLQEQSDFLIAQNEIKEIINLPYRSSTHGIDKAEGMVKLEDNSILLLYDSPGKNRLKGDHGVKADVFHLNEVTENEEAEEETPS